MKNLILYFSATGNSLEMAKTMQEGLENCEINNLMTFDSQTDLNDYDSIGFIYPCYYMSTPYFIRDKIISLNLPKQMYYYAVVTGGSSVIFDTADQLNQALNSKGCKLSYFNNVKMAKNYIMLYNPSTKEDARKLSAKAKEDCGKMVLEIIEKKTIEIKPKGAWFSDFLQKRTIKNKTSRDEKFYTTKECNGCGICEKVCKLNNIKLFENKPTWKGNCQHCTACIHWCPKHAIEYGNKTHKRRRYTNPNIKVNEI